MMQANILLGADTPALFDTIESTETSVQEHASRSEYDIPVTSSDVEPTNIVGRDIETLCLDVDDGTTIRINPFAVRESRTLTWKNVHMTLVRIHQYATP